MAKGKYGPANGGIFQIPVQDQILKDAIRVRTFNFDPRIFEVRKDITNQLPEAPAPGKVVTFNGQKYALPELRLKWNEADQADAIWFEQDEEGKLWLKIIVEAFRSEPDVRPLDFRTLSAELIYPAGGQEKRLPFTVSQAPYVSQVNVLKHVHAYLEVPAADKDALYRALTEGGASTRLSMRADVWWQQAQSSDDGPAGSAGENVPENCIRFNPDTLQVKGTDLAFADGRVFIAFRDPADAQKAFKIIRHYRLNGRCQVGSMQYFLSDGKAPFGAPNEREDAIPFDPEKLTVQNVRGNWTIVENGNHLLFSFGDNAGQAEQALKIIRKYGFDQACFVGRPNPPMAYLKRLKPPDQVVNVYRPVISAQVYKPVFTPAPPVTTIPVVVKPAATPVVTRPTTTTSAVFRPASTVFASAVLGSRSAADPQQIEVNAELFLNYPKDDYAVFRGLFTELEAEEFKWEKFTTAYRGDLEQQVLHYRRTKDPNRYFFLPQSFKLAMDRERKLPKIDILMYDENEGDDVLDYRFAVTCRLLPYLDPRARKDVYLKLNEETEGQRKYVQLVMGGYQSTRFVLNDAFFKGPYEVLKGAVTVAAEEFDPATGFDITFSANLESFKLLTDTMKSQMKVGAIYFDLEEITTEGAVTRSSLGIPVVLDLRDLANLPVSTELITRLLQEAGAEERPFPSGLRLRSDLPHPVSIQGLDLTLLCNVDGTIYDIDYHLSTQAGSLPVSLPADDAAGKEISLHESDINQLSGEGNIWNELLCEPYGLLYDTPAQQVLESVIDYASGNLEPWTIAVECAPFRQWSSLSEQDRQSLGSISYLQVQIEDSFGNSKTVTLDKDHSTAAVQLTRTLSQLLKTADGYNRGYRFRKRTYFATREGAWSEWLSSDTQGNTDKLIVYPDGPEAVE